MRWYDDVCSMELELKWALVGVDLQTSWWRVVWATDIWSFNSGIEWIFVSDSDVVVSVKLGSVELVITLLLA